MGVGCGKFTTDHALGSCRGGDPASQAAARSSPMGPPQTPHSSLWHQDPASVPRVTDSQGLPTESCASAAGASWGPLPGPLRMQIAEETAPLVGTLAYKGCPPRLSQLGAWRRDLPPWRRGLGLPATAAADSSSRDHVPSLSMSCFPAEPRLQSGFKK